VIRIAIAPAALLALAVSRVLPESGVGLYFRLAAATVVLLVPGWLIAEALGRRSGSATLVWSLAALTLALGIIVVLGLSLAAVFVILAAISVAALFAARRQRRSPRIPWSVRVLALGVLFGIALWHVAGHVDGDGLFHLARVRKLASFDELSLDSANEFADGGLHPGYAFPLWHGFLALIAKLAGVDPEAVVLHEPSVLAPLAFLVVFEAGATLFRSAWLGLAVLAANTAQISLAPGHGGAYVLLSLPATASRQLLVPAVLALFFTHVRDPSRAALAGLAAGGLALTIIHPTYSLFIAVPLAGFLIVRALIARFDARRIAAALAALGVATGAVVLALLPVVRETVSHNPSSSELERALRQYEGQLDVLARESYRVAPELLSRGGAVAVAALALIPLAAFAARRRWSAFVLGSSLAVLALVLVPNPFVELSDAVSLSQSRRAAGFVPFAFAFAGGAAVLARWLHVAVLPLALAAGIVLQRAYPGDFTLKLESGGGPPAITWFALFGAAAAVVVAVILRRRGAAQRREWLAGLAALLFVVPVGVHAARNWTPSEERRQNPLTPGLVETLREDLPEKAIIFSDLETSYRIGAVAPVYVAAGPPAHVADTDKNRPQDRRLDVLSFFRTGDLEIPRRYGADWLVVDKRRFELLGIPAPKVHEDPRYVLYRL
jgi:hypothetical protein